VLGKIKSHGIVAREEAFTSHKITDLEIIYTKTQKCSEFLKTILLAGESRYRVGHKDLPLFEEV